MKNIKKNIILLAVLFSIAFSSFAKEGTTFYRENLEEDTTKHYFIAAGGVALVNGLIGSYNRFVSRAPWAQVWWDDIKNPQDKDVKFDKDWYWTNFVLHPYQGGLYYLAARNSNLNLYESFFYTAAGSLIWEYGFETNSPSTNDFYYTMVGGVITGEMLYRLSLESQGRNKTVLSFLANPDRLFTDPILRQRPQGPTGLLEELSIRTGMGMAFANTWTKDPYDNLFELFPFNGNLELTAKYGDPYGHDSNTPYSQFFFEFGGGAGSGSGEGVEDWETKLMYDVHIFSDGMLFARAPDLGEDRDTTVGMVMEYDFVWNSFMEFSSIAPGFAFKQRINRDDGWLAYQLRLSAVGMGTSDFYYLRRDVFPKPDGTYRDYGYTTGGEFVAKLAAAKIDGIRFDWTVHNYLFWKYPYQVQDGIDDSGLEWLTFSDVSLELPVTKGVFVGISDELYFKTTGYDDVDNIFSIYNAVNLYARFNFLK
ncbi:MAG: DUF3943 domain-containing protein [Treponema sp.]|nr:DUF3943 domain-containing protein [Treponema sp.]